MSNPVSEREIIESLHHVPRDRWGDVLSFLESVQESASPESPVRHGTDLSGSKLIGIWKDRDDAADSLRFARQLREQAERRERTDASGH